MNNFLTPEAEAELAEAVAFYATNVSLNVARNFLAKFEEKARLTAEFPGIPIGRDPYSLLYRVHDGAVRISAIAAHARRPRYWQRRRP